MVIGANIGTSVTIQLLLWAIWVMETSSSVHSQEQPCMICSISYRSNFIPR
jgi:hypothetical protein